MTCGHLEDCPHCGHAGGYAVGTESRTVITMLCPACAKHYQVSTEKERRPNV